MLNLNLNTIYSIPYFEMLIHIYIIYQLINQSIIKYLKSKFKFYN